MLLSVRKMVALAICPELAEPPRISGSTSRDRVLLELIDAHQARCALSDWEIATKAKVNNRAVFLLRDGKRVRPETVCAMYEYLWSNRVRAEIWPISTEDEKRLFRVECVPAVERIGGVAVAHQLVVQSGRSLSYNSVQTWSRRGVPGYARVLIDRLARSQGIELDDADFSVQRLSKADLDQLRELSGQPKNRRVA